MTPGAPPREPFPAPPPLRRHFEAPPPDVRRQWEEEAATVYRAYLGRSSRRPLSQLSQERVRMAVRILAMARALEDAEATIDRAELATFRQASSAERAWREWAETQNLPTDDYAGRQEWRREDARRYGVWVAARDARDAVKAAREGPRP
jgi:hypothetical protein